MGILEEEKQRQEDRKKVIKHVDEMIEQLATKDDKLLTPNELAYKAMALASLVEARAKID